MVQMSTRHDVVVVGAGVFGAWTAYHLQRTGRSVLLVDAYGAGNSRSSSGDESRIIRMGYGKDEIYTRWSRRSLDLWTAFFIERRLTLFQDTGVLWLGHDDDERTTEMQHTLEHLGVRHERVPRVELERRYPQVAFFDVSYGVLEPGSGVLIARRAVQALAQEVMRRGGELRIDHVLEPGGTGRLADITTSNGRRITGDAFVFACGAWLPKLFPGLLGNRIFPTRQEVFYFGVPAGDRRFAPPAMPAWIDLRAGMYGLPDLEYRGFKIAFDHHGPAFDPDADARIVTEDTLTRVRGYLAGRFPDLRRAPVAETRVCQYENTWNGDFLIDRHPDLDNVWLVGGGSGHGFKHGPAVGEYVAARLQDGGPVDPRFSLATKAAARERSVF
jgi:sarcosine oxidase